MRKDKGCQEMSGDWLEQLEGRFSPGKLEEAGEESVQGPAGIGHTEFEMWTRGPNGEVSKLDMRVCLWRGPGGAEPPRLGAEDRAEIPAL